MVWYVRRRDRRIRIRAEYGTPEFDAEYRAAVSGVAPGAALPAAPHTLSWLIERYRETAAWAALSPATRRQRENIFRQVAASAGREPFASITSDTIAAGRDRRARTPYQARHFLDAMRGLFRWAVSTRLVRIDPCLGVTNPARGKSDGFRAWTEDDVAAYERRWPVGTRQRVWLDVLLYTGLRRGDAVRFGRQHVRNGVGSIRTEKSKHQLEVALPILPALQRTLDAGPCGDLAFICGARGEPLTKESFGNLFRIACKAAGLDKSAHGVRKAAATRAANAGATVAQLEAIFGWVGGQMASHYTRSADRRRLAKEAMHKLANESGNSMPAPDGAMPAPEKIGRKLK
jgi:integrase